MPGDTFLPMRRSGGSLAMGKVIIPYLAGLCRLASHLHPRISPSLPPHRPA